ncbi:caspase family protein [Calidithermus chliarophilus]|uniref:caspase family protein n=1 Tax=Calidithermus chliarophilus TaxID=52023 RepID=UPI0004287C4E|nr:caspase family protein [Calidithermus chliarophilus]
MRRWALAVLALALASAALAEDRALIIGIREYEKPLPGPDRDLELMRQVALKLGFQPAQVRLLKDREATREGILKAADEWLVRGTKAGDRAIFYFSGHGTQLRDLNGDEDDGCDEAIVGQDGRVVSDDEIDGLLQKVAASEIWVILDSCFSGTATKSALFGEIEGKLWPKPAQQPNCAKPANVRSIGVEQDKAGPRVISLSAAAQNEVALGALAVGQGSAFTQALYNLVMQQGANLSFLQLRDRSADAIRLAVSRLQRYLPHTPQLDGPPAWLAKDIYAFGKLDQPATPAQPYTGAVEQAATPAELLDRILRNSQFRVEIAANKPSRTYKLGEEVSFRLVSSKAGYLNLIDLGADGKLTVIFPNEFNSDNRVEENELVEVPGRKVGSFNFRAVEPAGTSRVLAIVTTAPLNLYRSGPGSLSGQFKTLDFTGRQLPDLAATMSRNIGVAAPPAAQNPPPPAADPDRNRQAALEHGAAEVVVEVVK